MQFLATIGSPAKCHSNGNLLLCKRIHVIYTVPFYHVYMLLCLVQFSFITLHNRWNQTGNQLSLYQCGDCETRPRGYKTIVSHFKTKNKAQWLAACGHVLYYESETVLKFYNHGARTKTGHQLSKVGQSTQNGSNAIKYTQKKFSWHKVSKLNKCIIKSSQWKFQFKVSST